MQVQIASMTKPYSLKRNEQEDGSVSYAAMNLEEYIIWCARISSPENRDNHATYAKLLNYLIAHKHWSPFEMVNIAFEIETSRAIAQQILRHRSFSFQEFSQRYAEAVRREPLDFRRQAETNRQSSEESVIVPAVADADAVVKFAFQVYERLIEQGVAKETARFVLPLCTQTRLIMNGTLRSWIHFCDIRCDEHAQKEIRDIAYSVRNELCQLLPATAEALGWQVV